MNIPPRAFRIDVDDAVLSDLRRRLRGTRWIEGCDTVDGRFGVGGPLLRSLASRWADAFDWRAAERAINSFEQFRVTIDGQVVHFLRIAGRERAATPLVLSHGWPWTFWDMRRVFAPLTDPLSHGGDAADAFELIVPSLPGFAFSTPAAPAGGNFWRTADLWHKLMTEVLGFERYGAAGADWGAFVTAQLGHKYGGFLEAVHFTQVPALDMFSGDRPWRIDSGRSSTSAAMLGFERRYASHLAVHMIEPDTLAAALHDSPAGLLAWLLQRWCGWSGSPDPVTPALTEDQMLTNATLFWATGSMPSSLRFYANAALDPWRPANDRRPIIQAPTGITFLAGDLPADTDLTKLVAGFREGQRGSHYDVVHVAAHPHGGHFAHFQNPDAVVADIRATFRAARRRGGG